MTHTSHPTYLEEDVAQIRRYFPGARAVALRTPFDLTERPGAPAPRSVLADTFIADEPHGLRYGDLLWTR